MPDNENFVVDPVDPSESEVVSEVTPLKVTHILPKLKKYFGVEKGSRISGVIPNLTLASEDELMNHLE